MESVLTHLEAPLIWLFDVLSARRLRPDGGGDVRGGAIGTSLGHSTYGEPVVIGPDALATHCYCLGSTGSGKTNFILKLLEGDLVRGESVAVVDLRGDLVERTLSLCASLKVPPERVTLLDLRESERVVGFNPLAGGAEPFVRALQLLDIIRSESDGWGVQLEETLRCALLLLAQAGRSLVELETLLFDTDFLHSCLDGSEDPSVHGFFERYQSLSEERQLSFALPVLNKVTPLLATEGLRCLFGSPKPIDLERVLNTKGSVLLVALSVDELHRSGRMVGALIVAALSRVLFSRVRLVEADRIPLRLYVDEFEAMASESFQGLIAEGRRFKLSLVLSHQNLSQLPPKLKSAIRNNVGLEALFRCGFEDAKELARELPDEYGVDELSSFMVGQMLLRRRGVEPELVQCAKSRPQVSGDDLAAYRAAVLQRTSLDKQTVLAGLRTKRGGSFELSSLQRPWGLGE